MIIKFIFFLLSFVLAGTSVPSALLETFNEKIVAGDIHALQTIIDTNSNFIQSPFAKWSRNEGFLSAVQEGRAPVVELLLKNANVDAGAKNNKAIRTASANGNVDIVRMLLTRPEVNPGAMENQAIIMAARLGHTEVVRLLLAHPKVVASEGIYFAAFWASEMNYSDIVKLFLINRRRVNRRGESFDANFHILERAAQFGNVDLVQYLLHHPSFRRIADLIFFTDSLESIKTVVEAGYKIDQKSLDIFIEHARFHNDGDIVKYLKSLEGKPNLPVKPPIAMTEQCAICLTDENLLEGYMTACNHQFHADCLQKWIAKQNSCPICRSSIL